MILVSQLCVCGSDEHTHRCKQCGNTCCQPCGTSETGACSGCEPRCTYCNSTDRVERGLCFHCTVEQYL